MSDKLTQYKLFEDKLRGAVLAAQDMELYILNAGEGHESTDFRFFEAVESNLSAIQQHLDRWRGTLPEAHSLYRATCEQCGRTARQKVFGRHFCLSCVAAMSYPPDDK